MRIKIDKVGQGLHPSEVVVQVETINGPERLVVDSRAIKGDSIDVGYPVAKNEDYWLVELPSETDHGAWRVWVDRMLITGGKLEAAE